MSTHVGEDMSDEDKLTYIFENLDDLITDHNALSTWEVTFIQETYNKGTLTNRELTPKEARKVDEIYEKLWQKDLL